MSLNEIIDGIAAAVDQDAGNANALSKAEGTSTGVLATNGRAGRHTFVVDEPAALGGGDAGPTPVEYALAGLIGCQVAVYRFWADKLGIALHDVAIKAEGDLDVRGFLGLAEGIRAGFSEVRFDVTLTGPESTERYQELRRTVDQHCPVHDLFSNPTPLVSTLKITVPV